MDTEKLAKTFVELADSLVDEFDVLELLHVLIGRCVDLLAVDAAGLLLADEHQRLRVAVSSSERARLLELFQLQNDEGPCLECYRRGIAVSARRLDAERSRWPQFSHAAVEEGFASVLALPLRLRGEVVGALNLFGREPGALDDPQTISVAQAMADVSTIVILQERLNRRRELVNEQLQTALNSRVSIEQAKGVLATRLDIGTDAAFELMRGRARDHRRRLVEVAEEIVRTRADGDLWRHLDGRH